MNYYNSSTAQQLYRDNPPPPPPPRSKGGNKGDGKVREGQQVSFGIFRGAKVFCAYDMHFFVIGLEGLGKSFT